MPFHSDHSSRFFLIAVWIAVQCIFDEAAYFVNGFACLECRRVFGNQLKPLLWSGLDENNNNFGSSTADDDTCSNAAMNRNDFFKELALSFTVVSAVTTIMPQLSVAAESSNDINLLSLTNQIAVKSALRSVKSSYKKITNAQTELYVSNNDYLACKELVRVEPLSEIRKSCSTLIKLSLLLKNDVTSVNDVNEPGSSILEVPYKRLMLSIEKFDSLGSLAIRGRKLQNDEYATSYQNVIVSLKEFITVAENLFVATPTTAVDV